MTIVAAIGATDATALGSAGAVTGPRSLLFFGTANIAAGDNATPASSTPVQSGFCGASTIVVGVPMIRPGFVTGLGIRLSGAAAGSVAIFGVYKNGTIVASLNIGITGGQNFATYPEGRYAFAANDVIDVRIRTGSGWSATTVDAAISVEIQTTT
jgi:hypothetical protein